MQCGDLGPDVVSKKKAGKQESKRGGDWVALPRALTKAD